MARRTARATVSTITAISTIAAVIVYIAALDFLWPIVMQLHTALTNGRL